MRQSKIILGATLAAALFGVTACGSSGTTTSPGATAITDADPASVTGTLRLLVPSYPASNLGKAALQKVVDAFNKTYPKVTVEPDFAIFNNLEQKISTSIAGGQGYDVYVTGIAWVPPFAAKGVFADLADFGVTPKTLATEVDPAGLPATTYNGKTYAVPLIFGPKPLAYSKKAFVAAGLDPTKPPTSWAELRADAKKLTQRNGATVTQAGFDFWAPPGAYRQDFVTFLGSEGAPLYKDGKPNFSGTEGVAALQTMIDMITQDKVTDFGLASLDGQPLMYSGKAAMGFVGGYVDCAKVGQATCDDMAFFNLTDKSTAMFCGGQLASIGATSTLKAAAYAFVKQLSTPEAEADIAALNFAVPAAKAAAGSTAVPSNPASTFVATALDHAVFEGGNATWLNVRSLLDAELDKALLGKESAKAALDSLAKSAG